MSQEHPDPWEWRRTILSELRPERSEQHVCLERAGGRRLAQPVLAPEDAPVVPESAMDGFAVQVDDLAAASATSLTVAADLPAAVGPARELSPGTAMRIMTGAPLPAGADTVIELELTDADRPGPLPAQVTIGPVAGLTRGRHVRAPGEEVPRGAVLAEPGDLVGAGLLGLAATLGIRDLPVEAPARVSVIVTGDELVADCGRAFTDSDRAAAEPRSALGHGAVRESNGIMLAAALTELGATTRVLRSSDDPGTFRDVLTDAADGADLVVTTGGIGRGAYDVVKATLGPTGAGTSAFAHLALRPGGPQGQGHAPGGTPMVHLPGTPVGALVGFHLFVRPLLSARPPAPRRVHLASSADVAQTRRPGRRRPGLHVQPGRLRIGAGGAEMVEVLPGRRLAPFGRADALVLQEDEAGDEDDARDDATDHGTVRVLPL